ncbi:MAG: DinB family protein [Anaerolineae bacterium]|nr:DinB family protein [Anaerolineae bacterium]
MDNFEQNEAYETIETLFRHNLWANTSLFATCAALSDEQLNSSIIGTYGSIRDTLEHIARAEQSYLHRVTTGQPLRRPANREPMTIAELQAAVQASGAGFVTAAPQVQPHDFVIVDWDGAPRKVPSAVILTQVINHATEHRAQIMATLTQIGIEPPDLSGWTYFELHDSINTLD